MGDRRRSCHPSSSAVAGLVAVALAATPALAAAPAQTKPAASLDQFLQTGAPLCLKAPAVQCIDKAFTFVDTDRDGKLSLAEVEVAQAQVDRWASANAGRIPAADRQRLVLGLLVLRTVGVKPLFDGYDADHDGGLTRQELTADLRLDQRTLPEILSDPSAVDWNGLAARAGDAAPLLKGLFEL